ncbi:hypothetical protein HanHA300_Chr01g0010541 [Helianthus annuus]|nr:hypothetical protein HanHA300_Chr01g0010541 [Helianthus annuus]
MLLCLVYDICFKSPSTRTNQLTIGFCYSATNFTRYQFFFNSDFLILFIGCFVD